MTVWRDEFASKSNAELDRIALVTDRKRLFTLYADLQATASKTWLVDRMLGAGELSAFYGAPGCGKGVIIEDMGLHIAAGLDWHGRSVMRGAVLYVALERKKLVERRPIAFREKHGLQNLPFAIAGGVHDFRDRETAHLLGSICRKVKAETGEKVVLVIVDTVSRSLAGGDENSPKDMGALVTTTAQLQEETRAHILLVHHVPHDSDRLRGHGALLGAVDTSVSVTNHGHVRSAKVVKTNDAEEGESVSFTIESVEIASDGTTAPVAVPIEGAAIPATAKLKRKLPDRARLGLDALAETLVSHGQHAPSNLQLPLGINVVTLDQWRDELCSRDVLDRNSNNLWRDFSRIRDQLTARQIIGVRNSLAWITSG